MKSIQAGLRAREIAKDHFERLHCAACDERLKTQPGLEHAETRVACPACGREWRDL